MNKSFKDYLTEAEQSMGPQPGDYLHIVTEDSVHHIQLDEDRLKTLLDLVKQGGTKGKAALKRLLGLGAGAGKAGLIGAALLGGGGGGGDAFKAAYDLASNQFVGDNPLIETLNKDTTKSYPKDSQHFIIDLR